MDVERRRHRSRFVIARHVQDEENVEVKRSSDSLLAAFNCLHKGYGGWGWTVLADSFATGMQLPGLSGIWMRSRGRTPRQMVPGVLGLSLLVRVIVQGPGLF